METREIEGGLWLQPGHQRALGLDRGRKVDGPGTKSWEIVTFTFVLNVREKAHMKA